jgi:hypothetical protein
MEKLSSIIHKSALETYDLVEKNKKLIAQLITMFLPKETRDFILNKNFEFNTYYSKSELEAIDIEMQTQQTQQTNLSKKKRSIKKKHKKPVGLSKSINKSKIRFLTQYIPESLLDFLIFFSYLSLHSIYFWSIFIILLFVTNINHLLIGLVISFINVTGNIIFMDCPIFVLEKKYRNKLTHNQNFICNIIKKIYDDQYRYNYEEIIEQMIFTVFLFFIKINLIILYKVFMRGLFNP